MDFIIVRFMHEVSKKKEKEPQVNDATMLSRQPQVFDNNERCGHNLRCYNHGKLVDIGHHYQTLKTL